MRFSVCILGLVAVAGCAASSSPSEVGESTANIENGAPDAGSQDAAADGGAASNDDAAADGGAATNDDAAACFTASGVDATMTVQGFGGGGATPTELIFNVTAQTSAGGSFVLTMPTTNRSSATITRSLPSADVSVVYQAQQNPDDFLSPVVELDATSGSVACGPLANDDYPCTFTDMVLTPKDADSGACATSVLPTFTLHVKVTPQ